MQVLSYFPEGQSKCSLSPDQAFTKDHVGLVHPGVGVPGQHHVGPPQLGIDFHGNVGQVLLPSWAWEISNLGLVGCEALTGNAQITV